MTETVAPLIKSPFALNLNVDPVNNLLSYTGRSDRDGDDEATQFVDLSTLNVVSSFDPDLNDLNMLVRELHDNVVYHETRAGVYRTPGLGFVIRTQSSAPGSKSYIWVNERAMNRIAIDPDPQPAGVPTLRDLNISPPLCPSLRIMILNSRPTHS